jgi:hypothetical protein
VELNYAVRGSLIARVGPWVGGGRGSRGSRGRRDIRKIVLVYLINYVCQTVIKWSCGVFCGRARRAGPSSRRCRAPPSVGAWAWAVRARRRESPSIKLNACVLEIDNPPPITPLDHPLSAACQHSTSLRDMPTHECGMYGGACATVQRSTALS